MRARLPLLLFLIACVSCATAQEPPDTNNLEASILWTGDEHLAEQYQYSYCWLL